MILWLDDKRDPADHGITSNVVWVKKYHEFVSWITENGLPEKIYFDHDLSDIHINKSTYREMTGYDCATWLVEYCKKKKLLLPAYEIQSINQKGKEKIKQLMQKHQLKQMQYPYLGAFKGENGSMGFQTSKQYQLKITHQKAGDNILLETTEGLYCEYQSVNALLNNWDLAGKIVPVEFNYKEITGWDTSAELAAYEKGRADEEKVITEWIQKWQGSTNSHMGQLLKDKLSVLIDKATANAALSSKKEVTKKEMITCPRCSGVGRTGFHPLMKHTCSTCDGKGEIPAPAQRD